jgi:uncharacterized protein YjeT (DUF2065 family)
MSLQSSVLLAVGAACLVVGLSTVFLPGKAARVSRQLYPGVDADDQQWRAVGLVTAGVGLLLLSSA